MHQSGRPRSYLVECYWPSVDEEQVAVTAQRARAAIGALRPQGGELRLLGSVLVPSDETVFYLFEGEEADVRAVSKQAGAPVERVLESYCIDGTATAGYGT